MLLSRIFIFFRAMYRSIGNEDQLKIRSFRHSDTDPASYPRKQVIYRKSRMSPINLKLNHHPPVLLLWHNPKIMKAQKGPSCSRKLGSLWSSKDQKEAFPFISFWLTRHVLWSPCARDHETANHTEEIKYSKEKINFPEEMRRKGTFNCGPITESLWSLTISGPDSYTII